MSSFSKNHLKPRSRKVKILATIGPSSQSKDVLKSLLKAGADAFRVNMSHGSHSDHKRIIKIIRGLERDFNRPIAILADLQGPKLRVGTFKNKKARSAVKKGIAAKHSSVIAAEVLVIE